MATVGICSCACSALQELDTTLQVLGLDGTIPLASLRVTASPHVPTQDDGSPRLRLRPRAASPLPLDMPMSRVASDVSVASRDNGIAGQGHLPTSHMMDSCARPVPSTMRTASPTSQSLQETEAISAAARRISLPPRIRPAWGNSEAIASSPLTSSAPRRASLPAGSASLSKLSPHSRLQSERRIWHADLDSLLEGGHSEEDLELAISLARTKAGDLTEQLTWWNVSAEPCTLAGKPLSCRGLERCWV